MTTLSAILLCSGVLCYAGSTAALYVGRDRLDRVLTSISVLMLVASACVAMCT